MAIKFTLGLFAIIGKERKGAQDIPVNLLTFDSRLMLEAR